jgi:hypothetical protein
MSLASPVILDSINFNNNGYLLGCTTCLITTEWPLPTVCAQMSFQIQIMIE